MILKGWKGLLKVKISSEQKKPENKGRKEGKKSDLARMREHNRMVRAFLRRF